MKDKKYIVYTQANKLGLKGEFDNAKDAIKWAKENVYAFDYLKERKDSWEDLFYELIVSIGKGVGPLTLEEYFFEKGEVIEC